MKSRENIAIQWIAHTVCITVSLLAVLPFILLIIASFTDNAWAIDNGYTYFPGKYSLEAYKYLTVQSAQIGRAYSMTIIVTAIGTAASLAITSTFAYGLRRTEVPGIRALGFILVFTMLFNGGLVATYYSYVRLYNIRNTLQALIVPSLLMNAFNVILFRNYFQTAIPESLTEAARLDGATELQIFTKVFLPLSKPIIATVGLMTALAYWNDWMNGMYYLTERNGSKYYTIQILMNNINENVQVLLQNASQLGATGIKVMDMPSVTIRMAIAVIGILPILIMYPFLQSYFVKGITIGGVKE